MPCGSAAAGSRAGYWGWPRSLPASSVPAMWHRQQLRHSGPLLFESVCRAFEAALQGEASAALQWGTDIMAGGHSRTDQTWCCSGHRDFGTGSAPCDWGQWLTRLGTVSAPPGREQRQFRVHSILHTPDIHTWVKLMQSNTTFLQ